MVSIIRALSKYCIVYATVATDDQRIYLKKRFPQLEHRHIPSSKNGSLWNYLLMSTGGEEANGIRNKLSKSFLAASLGHAACPGRFAQMGNINLSELGKFHISENSTTGISQFLRNGSFGTVTLKDIFDAFIEERLKTLRKLVQDAIDEEVVLIKREIAEHRDIRKILDSLMEYENILKTISKITANMKLSKELKQLIQYGIDEGYVPTKKENIRKILNSLKEYDNIAKIVSKFTPEMKERELLRMRIQYGINKGYVPIKKEIVDNIKKIWDSLMEYENIVKTISKITPEMEARELLKELIQYGVDKGVQNDVERQNIRNIWESMMEYKNIAKTTNKITPEDEERDMLWKLIQYGIDDGIVPIKTKVVEHYDIRKSWDFLVEYEDILKTIIKITPEIAMNYLNVTKPNQFIFNPKFSYLIQGGISEYLLDMVEWLVFKGTRKIAIYLDSKPLQIQTNRRLVLLKPYFGADVVFTSKKHQTKETPFEILTGINSIGGIRAVLALRLATSKISDIKSIQRLSMSLKNWSKAALFEDLVNNVRWNCTIVIRFGISNM